MTSRDSPSGSAAVNVPVLPTETRPTGTGAGQPSVADELTAQLDALELRCLIDPESVLGPAAGAEHTANACGHAALGMRARLLRGDALDRLGDVAAGGRIANEVNRWAVEHEHRDLMARSHKALSWFFSVIGDNSAHLEHALRAVEFLDDQSPAAIRADGMQTLAGALFANGSHEEARARFQLAEALAATLGDVDLQMKVLNNLSYGEHWAGENQAAMDAVERMVQLAASHGLLLDIGYRDTLARAQIGLGRYAEAEQTLDGLDSVGSSPSMEGDGLAQIFLTLTEAQRLLGATDRARATLDRCMALCEERGLAWVRVKVLQERAELFALDGAFQQAYEQHEIFHAEAQALLSVEGDVRARTLQAVFETAEARKDSLRFREMSLHDPLTGLYNRRYVDEQLETLLSEAAVTGAPLSVGLVDLDYFKLVNDTFSHAVGDEVLKCVAGLLTGGLTDPAFAARLGGEEFLLVMPGHTPQQALDRCEDARLRVRSHGWRALAGDLKITTSIGMTSVAAGRTTRSALLAVADRNLYAAKRAGRDRVTADPA